MLGKFPEKRHHSEESQASGQGRTRRRPETAVFRRSQMFLVGLLLVLSMMLAGLTHAPPTHAATQVLPDLGIAPFADFQIDKKTISGHYLLRFTSRIVNNGAGAFEVHGSRASTSQATMSITQTIYNSDGSSSTISIPYNNTSSCGPNSPVTSSTPGTCMFWAGDGHNHWHVYGLARYDLIRQDNGVKVGTAAKTGFCFNDNYQWNLSLPGAPQSPYYGTPTLTTCAQGNQSALTAIEGLSVGWGDTYPYNVYWQWVDITGLTSGRYVLKGHVDPNGWFTESNTGNNCNSAVLQITKGGKAINVISISGGMQTC